MKGVVRIVLGVVLIVVAWVAKSKAVSAGDGATLYLWGVETSAGAFWGILVAVAVLGGAMVAIGLRGLAKR